EQERTLEQQRITNALQGFIAQLPAKERLVLRLFFWEEMTIAEISRAIGEPQQGLYREMRRLLVALRSRLEAEGISRETAVSITEAESGQNIVAGVEDDVD